jgi:hypothetical protein
MIEGQEGVTWDDWVRLAALTELHGLEGFPFGSHTAIVRPQAPASTLGRHLQASQP